MKITICIRESCIRCGRCVKECPSQIFEQPKSGAEISIHKPENCIHCGHCTSVCPTASVCHSEFPAPTIHPIDYAALPTPEQVMLLCAARRSNRSLSQRPVPEELLDMIIHAANLAPTATNSQLLAYTLVTEPSVLRRISEYTLAVFSRIASRLTNPLVKPWMRFILPDVYRYVPVFKKMQREYAEGTDRILRGASAVLVIHAPRSYRFGAEDANLAYQNASLMAESLGVSQVYMGFVMTAVRQDRNAALNKILHLDDRRICAVMALGMPQFRYPNYTDRQQAEVVRL